MNPPLNASSNPSFKSRLEAPLEVLSNPSRGRRANRAGFGARQRGLSLIGLVVVVVVLGVVAVVAMRVLPTFVEYRAVNAAIKKATASASTVQGIQQAFDRSAAIDDITVMTGKDLDIQKVDDGYLVSYAYTKKVPLFGPVSLSIDYAGNSKSL